jgi:hypothetical protein
MVLIAGWFSFTNGLATAGDLGACRTVRKWLIEAGYHCDVALDAEISDNETVSEEFVKLESVDPEAYSHVIFVCGPFGPYRTEKAFLSRFQNSVIIGLNLSMEEDINLWNPFDILIERDSSRCVRPDIAFDSVQKSVPVVGICLVEPWGYDLEKIDSIETTITRALTLREIAPVAIDTRLDDNLVGLRTAAEVESLIAKMDVVVSTRLHGMVLALKRGVPVVAIDPRNGDGKISRQASVLNWPHIYTAQELTIERFNMALDLCLRSETRESAARYALNVSEHIEKIRLDLISSLLQKKLPERLEANDRSARFSMRGEDLSVPKQPFNLSLRRFDQVIYSRNRHRQKSN